MVDVASKRCGRQRVQHIVGVRICSLWKKLHRTAEVCAQHASKSKVNVVSNRCGYQGCRQNLEYGVAGTKTRELCAQHAREDMVILKSKRYGHGERRQQQEM